MAGESLIIGDGNWGVKSDSLLGYAVNSGRFVPRDLTFTRATTGTRTNGALLVETTPYNLLTYSEQFGTGTWATDSTSVIVPNAVTAPNGTLTADRLVPTTANAQHYLYQMTNYSGNNTVTIYAKANGYNYIALGTGVNSNVVFFNLSNGTIGTVRGAVASYSIESVGDGWYRCSVGLTVYTGSFSYSILVTAADNVLTFAGDGTSGVYLWGAQNVDGPSALTYLPTTTRLNIPRVDYSTGTAALLLEPQRTNIALRSEEFDSASWAKSGATVIANDTIAPNGLLAADRITQSGAAININQSISLPAGIVTFTTYVKRGNFDSAVGFNFGFFSTITGDVGYINFNFATGTTSVYSGTFTSHSATNVGNGWYRIQGTINIPSAGAAYFYNGGTGLNLAGIGSYYYSWGAQVEVGNCATSYIPTTSASVTRNADAIGRSGFQAAGLLTPTQNTFVFDFSAIGNTGTNYNFITFTATSGQPIAIWRFAGSQNFHIQISGIFTDTGVSSGKFAVVQSGSQTKLFVNGVLNTTGGATGTIDAIVNNIGTYPLASPTFIKSLKMYPIALSDAECINITK